MEIQESEMFTVHQQGQRKPGIKAQAVEAFVCGRGVKPVAGMIPANGIANDPNPGVPVF